MTVLVIGAGGNIGKRFLARFEADGVPTRSFDPLPRRRAERGEDGGLRVALRGCDRVLHLAATSDDGRLAPAAYEASIVGGARALCSALDDARVSELCVLSCLVVHRGSRQADASSFRAASRAAAEDVFNTWARATPGRQLLIVRPVVVVDPVLPAGLVDPQGSPTYVTNLVDTILLAWRLVHPGRPVRFDAAADPLTTGEVTTLLRSALGGPTSGEDRVHREWSFGGPVGGLERLTEWYLAQAQGKTPGSGRGMLLGFFPGRPRPERRSKPGILALAQRAGVPIVPVTFSCRPCVRIKSWDRTILPLPFARLVAKYGEPLLPGVPLEGAAFDARLRELDDALNRDADEVDADVGMT